MRIAITAATVRTALGDDAATVAADLAAGQSAIAPIEGFDATGFTATHGAQIWREAETPEDDPTLRLLGPHGRVLHAVASQAHAAAGLETLDRESVGLFVALGMVDAPVDDLSAAALASRPAGAPMSLHTFFAGAYRQIHPLWPLSMLGNVAAGQIAIDLDLRGDNLVLASDAQAGLRAILEGARSVAAGTCRAALVAGVAGRITPARLARRMLHTGATTHAPGEGGAALVLEDDVGARSRGAEVLGWIRGGTTTFGDGALERATDLTAPDVPRSLPGDGKVVGIGDLEAGGPATRIALVLADWAAHPHVDAPPRQTLICAEGVEDGAGCLWLEEAM